MLEVGTFKNPRCILKRLHAYINVGTLTGIDQRHSLFDMGTVCGKGHFEISLTASGRPGTYQATATIL